MQKARGRHWGMITSSIYGPTSLLRLYTRRSTTRQVTTIRHHPQAHARRCIVFPRHAHSRATRPRQHVKQYRVRPPALPKGNKNSPEYIGARKSSPQKQRANSGTTRYIFKKGPSPEKRNIPTILRSVVPRRKAPHATELCTSLGDEDCAGQT